MSTFSWRHCLLLVLDLLTHQAHSMKGSRMVVGIMFWLSSHAIKQHWRSKSFDLLRDELDSTSGGVDSVYSLPAGGPGCCRHAHRPQLCGGAARFAREGQAWGPAHS